MRKKTDLKFQKNLLIQNFFFLKKCEYIFLFYLWFLKIFHTMKRKKFYMRHLLFLSFFYLLDWCHNQDEILHHQRFCMTSIPLSYSKTFWILRKILLGLGVISFILVGIWDITGKMALFVNSFGVHVPIRIRFGSRAK